MYVMDTLSKSLNDNGIERKYEYRVVKSSFKSNAFENQELQAYGIEVERTDIIEGRISNVEREIIKNISPHRYKVQALAKMLQENIVSPINLVEILGEYVDDYVRDFDTVIKNVSIV